MHFVSDGCTYNVHHVSVVESGSLVMRHVHHRPALAGLSTSKVFGGLIRSAWQGAVGLLKVIEIINIMISMLKVDNLAKHLAILITKLAASSLSLPRACVEIGRRAFAVAANSVLSSLPGNV